jgi:hypothetical protein
MERLSNHRLYTVEAIRSSLDGEFLVSNASYHDFANFLPNCWLAGANTGEIILEDDDLRIFGELLQFLYTGNCEFDGIGAMPDVVTLDSIKLFVMGHSCSEAICQEAVLY